MKVYNLSGYYPFLKTWKRFLCFNSLCEDLCVLSGRQMGSSKTKSPQQCGRTACAELPCSALEQLAQSTFWTLMCIIDATTRGSSLASWQEFWCSDLWQPLTSHHPSQVVRSELNWNLCKKQERIEYGPMIYWFYGLLPSFPELFLELSQVWAGQTNRKTHTFPSPTICKKSWLVPCLSDL